MTETDRSDDALVAALAAGDAQALAMFEVFYDRHHRPAFALAYRILSGDHALAASVSISRRAAAASAPIMPPSA